MPSLTQRTVRPAARRRLLPVIDGLERRELCAVAPSDYAQYMLAMINRARANPAAEGQRLLNLAQTDPTLIRATQGWDLNAFVARISSLAPLPPLAFNTRLNEAAQTQNARMLAINGQEHSPKGFLTNKAVARASDGKVFYDVARASWVTGENVFAFSSNVPANATTDYVNYFHAAFMIDWGNPDYGHFKNLMSPGPSKFKRTNMPLSEIGIDIATDVIPSIPPTSTPSNPANAGLNVGPAMVTQEFGWRSTGKPILNGVVYADKNQNAFYDPTEGLGGVTVKAVRRNTRKSFQTTTWGSGGYSLPLPAGTYTVTASAPALGRTWTTIVKIAKDNVAWDLSIPAIQSAQLVTAAGVPAAANMSHIKQAAQGNGSRTPVSAGKLESNRFSTEYFVVPIADEQGSSLNTAEQQPINQPRQVRSHMVPQGPATRFSVGSGKV